MAEKKISELQLIASVSGGAILPIVAGDTTYKVGVEELNGYTQQLIRANITGSNTFTATQNFDGAVFLNGDVTIVGGITTTLISELNSYTSSLKTALSVTESMLNIAVAVTSSIVKVNNFLKLEPTASLLDTPLAEAGMVAASSSYGFTNFYLFDGVEWKWLVTGSI